MVICIFMKNPENIVASTAKSEISSSFENGQDATITRSTLIEMEHPRPHALAQVDNTTAMSFIDGTLKEKKKKNHRCEISLAKR